MKTSPAGRAYIESKEGLVLRAMRPMHGTDVLTIGFGHTGPDVYAGLVWTKAQADEAMSKDLAERFEPTINRICAGVPTTQGQFDAMVSLAYNVGPGAVAAGAIAKLHRQGKYDEAADAFEHYDHYHGQVNEALHQRRVEEGQMYLDASPD